MIAGDSEEEDPEMDTSDVEDSEEEDFDDEFYKEMIEHMDFEDLVAMMSDADFEQFLIDVGAKDTYVGGPPIEPVDDSSDYFTYGPHHVTNVFPYTLPRPAAEFRTFELFPKPPIEIRRMIWRATFRPRRHVWSYEDGTATCCRRLGLTHPPVTLFVNKESREESLKCYKKLEEGPQRCPGYARRSPFVFFNMDLDTLRTETRASTDFAADHFKTPGEVLGQIQYLELEEWAFQPHRGLQHDFSHLPRTNLKHFKALKQLTFIPIWFPL